MAQGKFRALRVRTKLAPYLIGDPLHALASVSAVEKLYEVEYGMNEKLRDMEETR